MVDTTVTFEKVLHTIDLAIKPAYLNKIQEIILQQTWEGKTYSEIAANYSYEFEYIKGAGCDLWKLLSRAFNEQISKNNFVQFMRRQATVSLEQKQEMKCDANLAHTQIYPWTTAPDVSNCKKQTDNIDCLTKWSQDSQCRFILVTGTVGSGKTTLVTQYAQQQQNNFNAIIWFSLQNSPQVEVLLQSCLQLLAGQLNLNLTNLSTDFDYLLNLLINYLRQYRCLLVLDSLQSIIEVGESAVYYRSGYEPYGQLLRCIITASHQSLLVATSRVKPKLLSFYSREQVRFLNLQGLNSCHLSKIFQSRLSRNFPESKLQHLWAYYMYNPQILNIVTANIERLDNLQIDDFLHHTPIIDEIDYLLHQEIGYLSHLEKQIIHWLAIDCYANSIKALSRRIGQFISKARLLEGLHNLQERGLINCETGQYTLAPLIKDYLQRKLVQLSLAN
ncbi:MAG: hypothetical protein Tsb0014_00180 [Pleurocapsa sp.]